MKRKGKLFRLLLIALILLFLYTNYNKEITTFIRNISNKVKDSEIVSNTGSNNEEEPDKKDETKPQVKTYDIVSTSESDTDIIKEIFAEGMNLNSYKKILDQKNNYISSNEEYTKIEFDFSKLHYSEIEDYLKRLNKSNIVSLEQVGTSVDNRKIYSVEIGKGTKTVFIDANIHAAETANTIMLLKFMTTIVNKYEEGDKEIYAMLNSAKYVINPCINPDGYEVYMYGVESLNNKNLWVYQNKNSIDFENIKSNANGVDINRNMPVQNAGLYYTKYNLISSVSKTKTTSNTKYFGGTSLGSEPETQAIMYSMNKHYKNTVAYINIHSQGRVLYQGKPNLNSDFNTLSKSFADYISSYNGYKVKDISSEEVGEGNDGSATDYMAELANGLKFSDKTLRLSASSYENNGVKFEYKFPVVTLETLNRYTRDASFYETEYNDYRYYDMFIGVMKKYIN